MEIFMELLNKIVATRNAQLVHMRNPTMMNNFTKIVYEVSFDAYLKDLQHMLKLSGHQVTFPKDWVKPKIEDLVNRYGLAEQFSEIKVPTTPPNEYNAVVGPASTVSHSLNFRHCPDCKEEYNCTLDGCYYSRFDD
jgi:hypothetical protein